MHVWDYFYHNLLDQFGTIWKGSKISKLSYVTSTFPMDTALHIMQGSESSSSLSRQILNEQQFQTTEMSGWCLLLFPCFS